MTQTQMSTRRLAKVVGGAAAITLALAACGGSGDGGEEADGGSLTIGTTDKVKTLDPAGAYDHGSSAVQNQIYPFLMNTPPGSPDVEPDIAESAEFTEPDVYTVTLKPDLKWANGNDLTASDVKFTFDRQLEIADANGPSSLLYNLDSTEVVDDLTVAFHLKGEDDQTFPQILSTVAGPIVDEDVFSATELTPDEEIVEAMAFAGPYVITNYDFNELISYEAYEDYQGLLPEPKTPEINVRYFAEASNLKLEVQEGGVDVAYRSLSATDIEDLEGDDRVNVVEGPGGEIRYMVFNFDTQPYGAKTDDADEEKSLAVRQAVAHLIDRDIIAEQVYKGTFQPLYSYVPDGLTGATESLKPLYGDGEGGPDAEAAQQVLEDAGVETPVELSLQYSNDHYGPSSGDEYALIKDQLEADGMFAVDLQTTEWTKYSEDRTADVYPAYQLGWFPDYSDADNYLTPFFLAPDHFLGNHYDDTKVNELIVAQGKEADPDKRAEIIGQIQDEVAKDLSTIPYMQGSQIAVTGSDVTGAEDTLDASFKFRYGALAKG